MRVNLIEAPDLFPNAIKHKSQYCSWQTRGFTQWVVSSQLSTRVITALTHRYFHRRVFPLAGGVIRGLYLPWGVPNPCRVPPIPAAGTNSLPTVQNQQGSAPAPHTASGQVLRSTNTIYRNLSGLYTAQLPLQTLTIVPHCAASLLFSALLCREVGGCG